jgi:ComF family protein
MKYLGALLNLFFPSKCPVCNNRSDSTAYNPICTECWKTIERYTGPACSICGLPAVSEHTLSCEQCVKDEPHVSGVLYYSIYDGVIREAIHLLKFSGIKRLSEPLGALLSELIIPEADGIVPVPLHKNTLLKREFNQTALIARYLSKALKIPLMTGVLEKIRETPMQTELIRKDRLKNVKNAYTASEDVKGKRLLLIDDVITTGATVRECARTLIKAGAEKVTVIALARSALK